MSKLVLLNCLVIVFIFSCFQKTFSQDNFGVRAITVSAQPADKKNVNLYQNKLDNNGTFATEPGLMFFYESFFNKKASFQISTAVFNDRIGNAAGFSQIMLKYRLFRVWKHSMSIGFGPALQYRKSWTNNELYVAESYFSQSDNKEFKLSWLSGEISYEFYINKKTDFLLSINHIQPQTAALLVGVKLWLGKKPRTSKGKGCNCPSYNN